MKITKVFPILFILLISGCAISDQVKSRELLAKCEYSLKHVQVESIDFDQMIRLVNGAKEVDFKNPGKDVLPLLKEIKDLKFDVNFTTLDFASTLAIKNPNAHEVILDSIQFEAFLDQQFVAKGGNGSRLNVPAKSEGETTIMLSIPSKINLKEVVKSEVVNIKGRVWLKLELIKGLPITLPFNFNVKQNVPREQIQKLIDTQKEKVVTKVVKELAGDKVKGLLKKF